MGVGPIRVAITALRAVLGRDAKAVRDSATGHWFAAAQADVMTARYRSCMSEPSDDSTAQLEEQLDGVSRTLSSMEELNARQAERVGARMDRLASQLLELSPPPSMDGVYQRLGMAPATDEEFASLVDEMGSPDGEG